MVFQARQDDRRAVDRARRPGGPAGRPRDRLRHPRQRRQEDRPHDDPDRQGPERARTSDPGLPAARRRAGRDAPGRVHRHRHPGRQHEPEGQPVLGQVRDHRPEERAPAGDAQDRHEQRRQGPQRLRLHRRRRRTTSRTKGEYALAVGAWNGNSDNTVSTPAKPVFSIDVTTYVWQGFLQEATQGLGRSTTSPGPTALVQAKIDPFTGLKPTARRQVDQRVVHPRTPSRRTRSRSGRAARRSSTRPASTRTTTRTGSTADLDWINRAERGPGVAGGVNHSPTAYFYNGLFQPVRPLVGRARRRATAARRRARR